MDDNLRAVEVAQYLDERGTLEADAHGLTVIVAGHALRSRLREVVVFGVKLQDGVLDVEADQVARVVGERLYTTQGCQQSKTVDTQLVGIVLGNNGVVVGVTALNQTAQDDAVAVVDLSIALVETDRDVATVFSQQVLQQRSGLLWQDKGSRLVALDGVDLVAHQLVTVRGNDCQAGVKSK